MPAGSRWLTERPNLQLLSTEKPFWHVYRREFRPFQANPKSDGRLALMGTHAMFYAADSLEGALWETVLRYVEPDASRKVLIPPAKLAGFSAIQLRLQRKNVPVLGLGQPQLRSLFPADTPEAAAVSRMLGDPDHSTTHDEAQQLWRDLQEVGINDMPVVSWPSRQLNAATVYLAYTPPMKENWWRLEGDPIELDNPESGHAAIHAALGIHQFVWVPLATTDTDPVPDGVADR